MIAGKYNFVIEQGATFTRVLTWKDSTGTAVNLTGYTARMQLREITESGTVILSLTTENSRISLGGSAGTVTLTILAADTTTMSPGSYVYDLELITGATVYRLVQGTATVSAEVTR